MDILLGWTCQQIVLAGLLDGLLRDLLAPWRSALHLYAAPWKLCIIFSLGLGLIHG